MKVPFKPRTTMTSREFNQNTARAKREAKKGPVIITERGEPSLVVMTAEEFDRLARLADQTRSGAETPAKSLAEALADKSPEGDFDFVFPEFKDRKFKPFEFD